MDNKELFFILPHPSEQRVLACREGRGWTLPLYPRRTPTNVGFDSPAPFNAWFREQYGLEVLRRYALDSEAAEVTAFVVEAREQDAALPAHASWVDLDALGELCATRPTLSAALAPAFGDAGRTMPWAQRGAHEAALAWMLGMLDERGIEPTGPVEQIKNAYVSTVLRCPTRVGDVYLKWLPGLFVREREVTRQLAEWKIAPLPQWLAVDATHNTILMQDMGGHDLDTGDAWEVWQQVMRQIARFQMASLPFVASGLPASFYDWRMPVLVEQIGGLAGEAQRLLHGSPYELAPEEVSRLEAALPRWKALCAEIGEDGIPDTLDHGDLRPGNIRVARDGILFYDWAWSSVMHPFISAALFLHVIRRTFAPDALAALRDVYLEAWTGYAPLDRLRALFERVTGMNMLQATIADAQWVREIWSTLEGQPPQPGSADAWTLDRRQYYLARVVRRLF